MILRCSAAGTTKPKLSGERGKFSQRYARLTVAVEAYEICLSSVAASFAIAELVRVRGVDTADEWLSDAIERFAAEASADKRTETFVLIDIATGYEQLARHSQFARP